MLSSPKRDTSTCDAPTAEERLSITDQDAVEFLRLHALLSTTETDIKPLRDRILSALIAGASSPAHLPFLLTNRPQSRKQRDWKGALREAYRRLLKSPTRADARMEKHEAEWPEMETPALVVEKNPHYILTEVQ